MRKALRWLLALVVLIGTAGSTAGAATAAEPEATGTGSTATSRTGSSPSRA